MEATLNITDSFLESDDEEENEISNEEPLAKLTILKNKHIPETELPLFLGDNILGRDPSKCTLLLQAPSISKQHATICIYAKRRKGYNEVDKEALVWDQGSVNGTRKGLSKLTPNLRYALSEGDRLVVADIPCKFVWCTVEMHKKFLNGSPKAMLSLPEDTRNTPARRNLLFSQPTPTDPRANLVTASDSDEEEQGVRRRKAQVSNSSFKSSPTSSTFLSPTSKMVLESVDESPITPPSSSKNRPCRHVSFSKEETDTDAVRQQLEEKESPAMVDVDEDSDLFHMGSDTDVDEDDDASDKVPKFLLPSEDNKPHAISFTQPESITMDSDTDVDDDDDAVSGPATIAKPVLYQSAHTADSAPSTQLKDIHLDSDTDVEEEEKQHGTNNTDIKMDETLARSEIKPSKPELDPAAPPSPHPGRNSESEASPAPVVSEPSEVSPVTESCTTDDKRADLDILSDSDTDVEEDSPPVMPVAVTSTSGSTDCQSKGPQPDSDADTDVDESREPTPGEGGIQDNFGLDSDTDVEEDSPLVIPVAITSLSISTDSQSKASQPDSDADTDVDESREPTPGEGGIRGNFGLDSDTDVEDEGDFEVAGKQLDGMNTQAFTSSSPGPIRGKQLEEMDTQAFTSPSPGPFRAPAGRPKTLSYLTDSSEDSDFVVAETQSFVLQSREDQENPSEDPTQAFCLDSSCDGKKEQSIRDGSLLLRLPESSHLQGSTQALAMESTQAFVQVERGVALEETQAYAANSNADTFSFESDANLEATQAYAADEEDAKSSKGSEEEDQVDLALETTQTYVIKPHSGSEDESDEGERKGRASAEAQSSGILISSTSASVETQPVTAFEKEQDNDNLLSTLEVNTDLCTADDTQPMGTAEDEESDEEDSAPGPRKKRVKTLPIQEEDTQPISKSEASADETQPMGTAEDEESDEEDSAPGPRKKRVKTLPIQEEDTQPISKSEASADETQPMGTAEDEESDEEDSAPGPRKKRVNPLPIQEEDTQPISKSEASDETQPQEPNTDEGHHRGSGKQSDAGRSGITVRGSRGRRTRLGDEVEESSEPSRTQTRGKKTALPTTRGRKGKSKPGETEEEDKNKEQRLKMESNEQDKEKLERKRQEEEERLQMENERLRLEQEQEEKERIEKERKEREETERLEHEKADRERKERLEKEEKEKKEKAENQRVEKEREEQLQRERMERLERENTEKERKDKEEKEKAERAQKEKEEKLEKERNDKIKKEILERERAEREEHKRKEQEEKLRLEVEKRKIEESLKMDKERQEREREDKEKQMKGQQEHKEEENEAKAPARGRRAGRRRTAASSATQDSTISADDDIPVRITRSRSNSVSSERSTLSVDTPESRGRGRGRGAKRTSVPPSSATARRSNRIVAVGTTQQDSGDISSQEALSRENSSTFLNSEISSCSLSTQKRGRGGRSRGRGRKLEADSVVNNSPLTDQNSTPKPSAKGRMSRRVGESSIESLHEDDDKEEADLKQAGTTRGQWRASRKSSAAAEEEGTSKQESATGEDSHSQRNVRGRGHKGVKSNAKDSPPAPAVNEGDGPKRKGRKRGLESNKEPSSSSNIAQERENAQETDEAAAEEEAKGETKLETPVSAKKRSRPSTAQAKTEKMDKEPVERKVRGRPSAAQNKRKEDQEESGSSVDQDAHLDALEPHTPTSIASRKRLAPADSSPAAKTPRSSSASSAAGRRSRAAGQAYKVLFTGIADKPGEKVLARLGGSMAKGVADMNCLVTDKVRRTVKFLCAVAKGVPIVTTQWLEESGKAGTLLCPDAFLVKDPEQEKKFSFCLQESLRIASSQPLLQGYVIHVTKSVMPEPVQMKDIISCSGATFLSKMPSSHKPQTVVISCEDDLSLCGPALSASVPVVSSEFILTGILQQKLDLQTHSLSATASNLQPAGGRGRGRKKT